jgi:hypothetical protein
MLTMVSSISMEESPHMDSPAQQNHRNLYNQVLMDLQQQQMTEYAKNFIPASRMKTFRDCLLGFNEEDCKKFTKISNDLFSFENMEGEDDEDFTDYNKLLEKDYQIFGIPFPLQMQLIFSAIDFYKSGFAAHLSIFTNNTIYCKMHKVPQLLNILQSFASTVFSGKNEHGQPLILSKKYRIKNIISNTKIAQHSMELYESIQNKGFFGFFIHMDPQNQSFKDDRNLIEELYNKKALNRITWSDFEAIKNNFKFETSTVNSFKNLSQKQLLLRSFKENIRYKYLLLMTMKLFLYKVCLYHNKLTDLTFCFSKKIGLSKKNKKKDNEERKQEEIQEQNKNPSFFFMNHPLIISNPSDMKDEKEIDYYTHEFQFQMNKHFINRELQDEITWNSIFSDSEYLEDTVGQKNINNSFAFKFSFYDTFANKVPMNQLQNFLNSESRLMFLFKFISRMKMLEQIKPLTLEKMTNPTADQKYLLKSKKLEFRSSQIKHLLNFLTILRHKSFPQINKDVLINNFASYIVVFLCGLDASDYNSMLKPSLKIPR